MSLPHPAKCGIVDAIAFNPLWLPGKQTRFQVYTIAGGQSLMPGSVLGQRTSDGKLLLATAAAGDGSQNPVAILGEFISTYAKDGVTSLDMTMAVAVEGSVNSTALVLGSGMTIAAVMKAMIPHFLFRVPGFSG